MQLSELNVSRGFAVAPTKKLTGCTTEVHNYLKPVNDIKKMKP